MTFGDLALVVPARLAGPLLAAGRLFVPVMIGEILVGLASGAHHLAIYTVLLASGSAAAVLPMVDEHRLKGREVAVLTAQITIADVATIVAVPLVLQPSRAGRAALGGLSVAAAAAAVYAAARMLRGRGLAMRLRRLSMRRRWALDLRLSLLVLFGLAWIAQLGVPAAIASLGIHGRVLTPAQGSAIVLAALVSLGVAAFGVELLARAAAGSGGPARHAVPVGPR